MKIMGLVETGHYPYGWNILSRNDSYLLIFRRHLKSVACESHNDNLPCIHKDSLWGPCINMKTIFPGMWIPIMKISKS